VPSSAVYAATKAYVLSFSEALATELSGTGVTVTALCPGATATGFQRVAGNEHVPKDFRGILDAETVARLGYEAMLKGRRVVVTGLINRILVQGVRLVPRRLATDMAFRVMRKRGKW
jgi:short-subunit dehydrogenase